MTDASIAVAQKLAGIPLTVVSQGAEAVVFSTSVHPYLPVQNHSYIVKFRPLKKYRHPKIDAAITKSRTVGEVRFMHKLTKLGIRCPRIIHADFTGGLIWMERIGESDSTLKLGAPFGSLKSYLWDVERNGTPDDCVGEPVADLCRKVGSIVGQLHANDMIHGDLTSSNILLQEEPYLIDFGLSSYSSLPEDKAVDLYVLERAIQSTHSKYAEQYNKWMLEGYKSEYRKCQQVLARLEDVRQRGRKRSMLG